MTHSLVKKLTDDLLTLFTSRSRQGASQADPEITFSFPHFEQKTLEDYGSDSEEAVIIKLIDQMLMDFSLMSVNPELSYKYLDENSEFVEFLARRQLNNWRKRKRHIDIHKEEDSHKPTLESRNHNQRVKILAASLFIQQTILSNQKNGTNGVELPMF